MAAVDDIAQVAAWIAESSPAKRKSPLGDWTILGPYAVLLPLAPDSPASTLDLSEIGEGCLPLLCAPVALPAPVLEQRIGWDCAGLPSAADRLKHLVNFKAGWSGFPRLLAVGITSPSQSMNEALAAEGLAVDLAETATVLVPSYAITAKDRAKVLSICRSTYTVHA